MSIISRTREYLQNFKPAVSSVRSYFNPTSNQGNNFWSSTWAKRLSDTSLAVEKKSPIIKPRASTTGANYFTQKGGWTGGFQRVRDSKLKDYFLPTASPTFRNYISEALQSVPPAVKSAYQLTPIYQTQRAMQGNPVTLGEVGQDALNVISPLWQFNPARPVYESGFGVVKNIRRSQQGKAELNPTAAGYKGLEEHTWLGSAITDNEKVAQVIDIAFMVTMIAKPYISKKLNQVNLKSQEINQVSNTLGVKPTDSMATINTAWKKQVAKYSETFAGRGSQADMAKVKELNNSYNVLKNTGIIDRKQATAWDWLFKTFNKIQGMDFGLSIKKQPRGIGGLSKETAITKPGLLPAPQASLSDIKALETRVENLQSLRKSSPGNQSIVMQLKTAEAQLKSIQKPLVQKQKDFVKMGEGQTSFEGLMRESPMQTKARRDAQLSPQEAYSKSITKSDPITSPIRSMENIREPEKFSNLVKNTFEKDMGKLNDITPKEKVNIVDYLRTPDRVLKKIGLKKESDLIRQKWSDYLDELPKEIDRVSKWADRVPGEASNKIIFKHLDGQIQASALSKTELQVATEIKSYLSSWADRLGLPKDKRITSYITHIWERDMVGKEFPAEIANLIRDKVPGSVYDPFVAQRLGSKGYVEDTWRALDAYVKRGVRKANMDDALKSVQKAADGLEDSQFRYVKSYIDKINLRPSNIDNLLDNAIKSTPIGHKFGTRPTAYLTRKGRQYIYRGLLGLNPASALKNLSQGANTYAELGEKYFIKGYTKVVQEMPKYLTNKPTELEREGVLRDNFIQDRQLSATKKNIEKMDKTLFYMFDQGEKINRGASYYGQKAKSLDEGKTLEEAIKDGVELARKTQFTFSAVDTPIVLQSDIAKLFTQFWSYSIKQGEYLGEKVAAKEWAGLIRYIASSLLFIAAIGKTFGMEWKDIIPTVRFSSFLKPPTLQPFIGAYDAAAGTPDKFGNEPDPNMIRRFLENKDIQKGLVNYIPAGGQMRKTYQGLKAYVQGESTTPSGNNRFDVEQTPSNLIKSSLFGQYSSTEGRQYIQNLGTSKSERRYNELKKLSPEEAAAKAKQLKAQNPTGYRALQDYAMDQRLKVTTKEKRIRGLTIKDGRRARAIIKEIGDLNTPQEKADLYKRYLEAGIISDLVDRQLKAAMKAGVLK